MKKKVEEQEKSHMAILNYEHPFSLMRFFEKSNLDEVLLSYMLYKKRVDVEWLPASYHNKVRILDEMTDLVQGYDTEARKNRR